MSAMFLKFIVIFFGSIIFGALVGLFVSLILKYLQFDNDQFIELSFFFFFSYIPYIFSEAIGLSGILSILFTGIVMGHYARYSLSPISRITVESVLKVMSSIAEIFIFAYLGISFPLISVNTPPALVMIGSAGLLVSRAVAIFLMSMICNMISTEKIKFSHQIIIWFSGLRGAVAFYLALNTTSENQSEIISSTLWLILLSTGVLGLLTPVVLNILDRCYPRDKILISFDESEMAALAPSLSLDGQIRMDSNEGDIAGGTIKRSITDGEILVNKFSYFDIKYMRSILRKPLWQKYEKGFKDIIEYNNQMVKYRKRKTDE